MKHCTSQPLLRSFVKRQAPHYRRQVYHALLLLGRLSYSPSHLMRLSSKVQLIKFDYLKYSFGHYYSYKFSLSSTSSGCFTLVHAFSDVLMFKNTLKSDLNCKHFPGAQGACPQTWPTHNFFSRIATALEHLGTRLPQLQTNITSYTP